MVGLTNQFQLVSAAIVLPLIAVGCSNGNNDGEAVDISEDQNASKSDQSCVSLTTRFFAGERATYKRTALDGEESNVAIEIISATSNSAMIKLTKDGDTKNISLPNGCDTELANQASEQNINDEDAVFFELLNPNPAAQSLNSINYVQPMSSECRTELFVANEQIESSVEDVSVCEALYSVNNVEGIERAELKIATLHGYEIDGPPAFVWVINKQVFYNGGGSYLIELTSYSP